MVQVLQTYFDGKRDIVQNCCLPCASIDAVMRLLLWEGMWGWGHHVRLCVIAQLSSSAHKCGIKGPFQTAGYWRTAGCKEILCFLSQGCFIVDYGGHHGISHPIANISLHHQNHATEVTKQVQPGPLNNWFSLLKACWWSLLFTALDEWTEQDINKTPTASTGLSEWG